MRNKPIFYSVTLMSASSVGNISRSFANDKTGRYLGCAAFLLIFLAYFYQSAIPAYNPDDIATILSIRQKITHGRWMTLIGAYLFENNPLPVISLFIASILIYFTFFISAQIIGLKHPVATFAFITLGSISHFWEMLFSFDTVRIYYAFANFMAIFGIYSFFRYRWFIGCFCLSIATATYQPSLTLALTVIAASTLIALVKTDGFEPLKFLFRLILAICASLLLYFLSLKIASLLFPVAHSKLMVFSPIAAIYRLDHIWQLFRNYSFPILPSATTEPSIIRFARIATFAFFLIANLSMCVQRHQYKKCGIVLLFLIFLFIVPYIFVFVQIGTSYYPAYSLYSFSVVFATGFAVLMENIFETETRKSTKFIRYGRIILVSWFILCLFISVSYISQESFNKYLLTQSDLLIADQMISRIETIQGDNEDKRISDIPILVFDNKTRGANLSLIRSGVFIAPWSKDRIFSILDSKYISYYKSSYWDSGSNSLYPVPNNFVDRGYWPAEDSVFIQDGVIIIRVR